MSAHEFIVVGRRRWCLGCDLFQVWRAGDWQLPPASEICPRTTPHAKSLKDVQKDISASDPVQHPWGGAF